jgi:hypothetical protein
MFILQPQSKSGRYFAKSECWWQGTGYFFLSAGVLENDEVIRA